MRRELTELRDVTLLFEEPKTAKGRRAIPLPPTSVLALREHRQRVEGERLPLGRPALPADALVFTRLDGTPMLPGSVSQAWRRLARAQGITVRLHDLRHTHASLMLKAGVHPKVVQERLGHATINITLDTYSHLLPGLQEQAALRFEEARGSVEHALD